MRNITIVVALTLLVLAHVWTLDALALEAEERVMTRPASSVYVESIVCAEWHEVSPDQMPVRFRIQRLKSGSWDWYELLEGGHYVGEEGREYEKRIPLSLEEGDALLKKKETAIGFVTDWSEPEWKE